jgi:hypothetical protein
MFLNKAPIGGIKMNKDRQVLLKNNFMANTYLEGTVSDYLFATIRDKDSCRDIDETFDWFVTNKLEGLTEREELNFDIVLMFMEIHSFSSFLNTKFTNYARITPSALEWDVYTSMLSMFTDPIGFYKTFGSGYKLERNRRI